MPFYDDIQLNKILDHVMTLPKDMRDPYLDEVCEDDDELRIKIEKLIASCDVDVPEEFLQPSPVLTEWIRTIYRKLIKIRYGDADQEH